MSISNSGAINIINKAPAIVQFSMNYIDTECKQLFGAGAPKLGGTQVKSHRSRLLVDVIAPSKVQDGVILYNKMTASCSPGTKFNTFQPYEFNMVFGFLNIGHIARDWDEQGLDAEDVKLLHSGQIKPLELPKFLNGLTGQEIQSRAMTRLDQVVVTGNFGKQVVARGQLQNPESGLYLLRTFRSLAYKNEEMRKIDDSIPVLQAFERPTKEHFNIPE